MKLLQILVTLLFIGKGFCTNSTLSTGVQLPVNSLLLSENSLFTLRFQSDGNLCGYNELDNSAYWCTSKYDNTPAYVLIQPDCNLVAISTVGDVFWSSNTSAAGKECFLKINSDRNIVLYNWDLSPVWSCSAEKKGCTLDNPRSASLQNNILFGYQGWFATDEGGLGWIHWSNGSPPNENSVTFDLFPDISDFPQSILDPNVNLTSRIDGLPIPFYDALGAVDVHFSWMSRYGINGVVVQRFVSELTNPTLLERRNKILEACQSSAEKYNKVFMIEYDISGADPNNWMNMVVSDWDYLANTLQITASRSYQHESGKPVVMLFGIGFTEHPGTPSEAMTLINTLQDKFGCYFVGGVPTYWRDGDSDSQPGFSDVYATMDTISPWLVGRFSSNREFQQLFNKVLVEDVKLTSSRGQRYAPTVFPGFSWTNVQRIYGSSYPLNQIPRNGGAFWEYQVTAMMNDLGGQGAQFIFGAMFDEFDEGTAMAKAASTELDLPVEGTFLYLSIDGKSIAADYYLELAGRYSATFNQATSRITTSQGTLVSDSEEFDEVSHKQQIKSFEVEHNRIRNIKRRSILIQ